MIIDRIELGINKTNCYIIGKRDDEGIIIDPGAKADIILEKIEKYGLEIKKIINTHGHFDHIGGNAFLKNNLKADIYIHRNDKEMLTDINKNLSFYLDKKIISPPADDLLSEGEIIEVACFKMKVIHTPGHSPGSISLYDENLGLLFSGDTIFKFGVGRTDLYGSNEKQLKDSINKLLNLPEIVKVYPGHGEETSIKDFRKNNWYYI